MICAELVQSCAVRMEANLNRFSSCSGIQSVLTTERYLGCKQNLGHPVNDLFDLKTDKPDEDNSQAQLHQMPITLKLPTQEPIRPQHEEHQPEGEDPRSFTL